MPEPKTIKKENKLPPAEDYNFLRREGIRLIQSLSGKVWTDYNTHDPGITLLEALCYTLTDLGYRTSFNMPDLLAPPEGESADWQQFLYTARRILPCNPVTLNDYRKLVIDTEGVRNAWVEPSDESEIALYLQANGQTDGRESYSLTYDAASGIELLRLQGLYKVYVDFEPEVLANKWEDAVFKKIRAKLNAHRNLCEDFLGITSVEYAYFQIEADVQVNEGTDVEKINAQIYKVIFDFFSPAIAFYSLEQMMARGCPVEDIFEGPLLTYGFIDTEELERSERYKEVHLSDIMSLMANIPGVIAVKKLEIHPAAQPSSGGMKQWISEVKEKRKAPRLDTENSVVTFSRSGDRHREGSIDNRRPNKERVKAIFSFLQTADFRSRLRGKSEADTPIPPGEFMDLSDYYPLQKTLPGNYGLSENYLQAGLDVFAVRAAVNELLDGKIGKPLRLLLNQLYDERQDKAPVQNLIRTLLENEPGPEEARDLIAGLLEEENKNRLANLASEELGRANAYASGADAVAQLLQSRFNSSLIPSRQTRDLQAVAAKCNCSLADLIGGEDLGRLEREFKTIQLNRLSKREKQALQLQGFLMVFEQILSDYLFQLAHLGQLFSFDPSVSQTYFPQPLQGIPNLESLFVDFGKYRSALLRTTEREDDFLRRRDGMLDHLLGRFAESLDKYSFFLRSAKGRAAEKELIQNKIALLADYEEISSGRGKGFDYTSAENTWDTARVEGLKKRICRLLGLKEGGRSFIASDALFIEEVPVDNTVRRYEVVLKDPADKNSVLLRSIRCENMEEAEDTLKYILENGHRKNLYEKEGRKDRWLYHLKRPTQEADTEIIATGLLHKGQGEMEAAFAKTTETLTAFSEAENFHLIEHILLRPKTGSREKNAKSNAVLDADTVYLLPAEEVLAREDRPNARPQAADYRFVTKRAKDKNQKGKEVWKLSLVDAAGNEVLLVEEDFVFHSHLNRRKNMLRQFGSERASYSINTASGSGDSFYSIMDDKRPLGSSKKRFSEVEELEAEIAALIRFFSFESGPAAGDDANGEDVGFYADPYSFRISIFIPNWPEKFRNPTFRHLFEKTIYLETPAHIYPRVYWLDHRQMREVEEAYKVWIEELAHSDIPNTEYVNNLINVLSKTEK